MLVEREGGKGYFYSGGQAKERYSSTWYAVYILYW